MSSLLTLLLILASLIAFLLILALFLKKEHYVSRQTVIKAPAQQIYDFLRFLKNQEKFNKWAKTDPDRKVETKGTDGAVGYVYSWSGNKDAGQGAKEIVDLVPGKKVETEIRFTKPMQVTARMVMETEALSENQTKVTFTNKGRLNYPLNIMIPFAERNFAKDLDGSLLTLKKMFEQSAS